MFTPKGNKAKLIFCSLILLAQNAHANPLYISALDQAVTNIRQQQKPDGSWGANDATHYITTSSLTDSLRAYNKYNTAYNAGIAWLENHNPNNVDALARKITTLYIRGNNLSPDINQLNAAKADPAQAGWGLSASYQSDAMDSALALTALINSGDNSASTAVSDYLASIQLADGGWTLINNSSSDYLISAQVVTVLATLAPPPASATTALANATPYLQAAPIATSSSLILAQTALALYRQQGQTATVTNMVNELLSRNTSGSWGDLYSTASVMRLLAALLGTDSSNYAARANIQDASLRIFLNGQKGGNAFDNITQGDVLELTTLDIRNTDITTLNGLEGAINLIDVKVNAGTDTTAIAGIPGITILIDSDSDNISDATDNCPNIANPGQEDFDNDGIGDVCDNDQDNDGILNASDPYPLIPADGDLNADGQVNAADLLIAQRIALGNLIPTNTHLGHGDVAPLIVGVPAPDGVINTADLVVIQRKVFGQISF